MLNLIRIAFLLTLIIAVVPTFFPPTIYNKLASEIISTCQDKELIVLGEKHRQPDSQALFLSLVRTLTAQGDSVFVGLEIPSERQDILNRFLAGEMLSPSELLSPLINHSAYIDMLQELGAISPEKLTLRAIDATQKDTSRDGAMCRNIMAAVRDGQYDKVVVLVGNIHASKHIKWHPEVGEAHKYLAGRLIEYGVNPCSIFQSFAQKHTHPKLLYADNQEGALAAMKEIDSVYHAEDMSSEQVADSVMIW